MWQKAVETYGCGYHDGYDCGMEHKRHPQYRDKEEEGYVTDAEFEVISEEHGYEYAVGFRDGYTDGYEYFFMDSKMIEELNECLPDQNIQFRLFDDADGCEVYADPCTKDGKCAFVTDDVKRFIAEWWLTKYNVKLKWSNGMFWINQKRME